MEECGLEVRGGLVCGGVLPRNSSGPRAERSRRQVAWKCAERKKEECGLEGLVGQVGGGEETRSSSGPCAERRRRLVAWKCAEEGAGTGHALEGPEGGR